jgi:hypothetical protein
MGRKEGGRTRACKDDGCWPSTSGGIKTPGPSEAGRVSNRGFRLGETHWRCRPTRSTRTAEQTILGVGPIWCCRSRRRAPNGTMSAASWAMVGCGDNSPMDSSALCESIVATLHFLDRAEIAARHSCKGHVQHNN